MQTSHLNSLTIWGFRSHHKLESYDDITSNLVKRLRNPEGVRGFQFRQKFPLTGNTVA